MAEASDVIQFWSGLGTATIHPRDQRFISPAAFETSLLPQPWVGPLRDARVYVLQLNPGLDGAEIDYERSRPDFRQALVENLLGQRTNVFLDRQFADHPGYAWVQRVLGRGLRADAGSKICMIELVPYHSRQGTVARSIAGTLPSTRVIRSWVHRHLLPRAKSGEVGLVVQRGAKLWGFDSDHPPENVVVYNRTRAQGGYLTPITPGGVLIADHLGSSLPVRAKRQPSTTHAIEREAPMTLREQDTNQTALAGQLGKCESGVRETFIALDQALDRSGVSLSKQALKKSGGWYARSYKLDDRKFIEVHPKGGWLKVDVGAEYAAMAPRSLVPVGETRDAWIRIEPRDRALGITFVLDVLSREAAKT